jgi:hypothetical protein
MGDSADNHIVQAMLPVYAEARLIKSRPNAVKDRTTNFERGVTKKGHGVWMRSHDAIKEQLEALTSKYTEELKSAMHKFLVGIERRFDMMCSDKEVEDEEEEKLRETLQKTLVIAREKLACEVRPAAQACFGSI